MLRHSYVGGGWASAEGPTFSVVNPATEEPVAELVAADADQVDQAVRAAQAAQRQWAALSPGARGQLLWRWAELIEEHADELARLDSACMGRPLRDALSDTPGTARRARYWAGMCDKIWGEQVPVAPGHLSYTHREPIGVVGVIIPWNGPTSSFVGRTSAALACGNAVIVKPSELAPLSALRLAELTTQAGMPPGLVNVVVGEGATGGEVVAHPDVRGIQFTGSVGTGRRIAVEAARTFKQVVLEMGGKSPNIVFADADLPAAVRGAVWGVFFNAGQVCCGGTRLLVERSIADEFVAQVSALARRVRVGDPQDLSVHIGPVASAAQYERVLSYCELGKREGAGLLAGGERHDAGGGRGYYVSPTVFSVDDASLRIAREEVFGPVLTVLPFDDEEQAVAIANDSNFGLAANIWTRDVGKMVRVAHAVDAATIWGNTMRLLHPALPFGGFKDSGLGNSAGSAAIDGLTRLRRVSIRYADVPDPGWDDLEDELGEAGAPPP